jgi:hypothetical protein
MHATEEGGEAITPGDAASPFAGAGAVSGAVSGTASGASGVVPSGSSSARTLVASMATRLIGFW